MLAAAPLLTAAAMPASDAAWSALIRRYEDAKRRELLASSELARAEAGCERALAALKEPADYGVFRRGDTVDAYNDRAAAAEVEQVQRQAAVRASFAIDALEDAQTEAGETLYDIVTEIIHFPVRTLNELARKLALLRIERGTLMIDEIDIAAIESDVLRLAAEGRA